MKHESDKSVFPFSLLTAPLSEKTDPFAALSEPARCKLRFVLRCHGCQRPREEVGETSLVDLEP